jgi:hypothetical protein
MSAVKVLASAREVEPAAFGRSEGDLVEAARIHSLNDLQRVTAYRRQAVERADALGEICRQWLDGSERPTAAGERPHVTVTVAADALHEHSAVKGGSPMSELDHVGPGDPGDGSAARLRRVAHAGDHDRAVGAARRRQAHTGGTTRDAPSRDRARSPLPVPRLRPPAHVVRHAPLPHDGGPSVTRCARTGAVRQQPVLRASHGARSGLRSS